MSTSERLGLIAGEGGFPLALARSVRRRGGAVCAVAFHGITDPELADTVDSIHWLHLGEVEALLTRIETERVDAVALAGKVSKQLLFDRTGLLRPDATALAVLDRLEGRGDAAILAALAELLEERGVALRAQGELVPELLAGTGPLGRHLASGEQLSDMAFGWRIAKEVGRLDIGQAVVVERGAVLAIEAIEGTDEAIRRGGRLGRGAACLVKVVKPGQDLRLDLPSIGPGTLDAMLEANVAALAFEASCTIILDRDALTARADDRGIPLMGFGAKGPRGWGRPDESVEPAESGALGGLE